MRIRASDVRKITVQYKIETNDEEAEPVEAGLLYEFTKELVPTKRLLLEMAESIGQIFKDFFEKEVE